MAINMDLGMLASERLVSLPMLTDWRRQGILDSLLRGARCLTTLSARIVNPYRLHHPPRRSEAGQGLS